MRITGKEEFLKRSGETLESIYDMLEKLPPLKISDLKGENTALVIVDMINGFAREGALKSPRVEELTSGIAGISKLCDKHGITKLAFADSHTDQCPEFDSYPVHCMAGTSESEILQEIKEIGGYRLIAKNSTNGFLEAEFQEWLGKNPHIDTFIAVGDCTDICIEQFTVTLKAYFNIHNKRIRVIVPENAVDTYDLGLHNGDLLHAMALFKMMGNGVEIAKGIEE